jgi:hypothetical protein
VKRLVSQAFAFSKCSNLCRYDVVGFAVYQVVKTREDVQALQRDFDSSFAAEEAGATGGGGSSGGGGRGSGDGVRTPLLDKVGSPGHGSLSSMSHHGGGWGGGGGGGGGESRGAHGSAARISEPESFATVRGNFVQIRAGAELGGIHH